MQLANAFFAILVLFCSSRGYAAAGGLEKNFTAVGSRSRWLKNVTQSHRNPFRPRLSGCRLTPWICREGVLPPGALMHCCRDQCVDVSSDINNCGLCGIRCPFAWQCCRGICVDTNVSPFNCGRCGNRCPWMVPCEYGMCGYAEPWHPWPHPHPHPHPLPRPHPCPHPRPHFPPPKPPSKQPHDPPPIPPRHKKPWPPHIPKGDGKPAEKETSPSA